MDFRDLVIYFLGTLAGQAMNEFGTFTLVGIVWLVVSSVCSATAAILLKRG